jgi:hypothetical protein
MALLVASCRNDPLHDRISMKQIPRDRGSSTRWYHLPEDCGCISFDMCGLEDAEGSWTSPREGPGWPPASAIRRSCR